MLVSATIVFSFRLVQWRGQKRIVTMSRDTENPHLPSQVLAERVHLRIPSLPGWIEPTVEFLRQKAVLAGACPEDRAGKLLVALHEALSNAVVHGNLGISSELKERDDNAFAEALAARASDPELSGRVVDIVVDYDGENCHWTITDQGQGFDVPRVLERCLGDDPEMQLASGRGILMMHSLLDAVRYELEGRRVILSMRRPSGPERRQGARTTVHRPLQVVPLRPDGSPDLDAAFAAVSRDLSATGVALLQDGVVPCERVFIGFPRGDEVTYVPADVRHCRPLGDGSMELGCRFLVEVGATGEWEPKVPEHLRAVQDAIAGLLELPRLAPEPAPERRDNSRVPFNERIEVLAAGLPSPVVGFARDLSHGGISFVTRANLPGEITIILRRPGRQPALGIRAHVVRCVKITEGFFEVAAHFARLDNSAVPPHAEDAS
jgi:anti-sigma regulatory factor (Ser/Thr protein kinase)